MAKASFHKNQRVYVKPVGTWAQVERVVPHWTKGLEEPIRVVYDVGLGRHFLQDELQAPNPPPPDADAEAWRIQRVPNTWQPVEETNRHPFPGTCPVVTSGEPEWGGWRVSGAEYALSPARVERQARMLASAPRLAAIVRTLGAWAEQSPNDVPEILRELTRQSRALSSYIDEAG